MKIDILGTGNAFSAKRNNTSFVMYLDRPVMVECPKNLFQTLAAASLDVRDINDVVISHCHADHMGDVSSYIFHKRFVEDVKPKIYAVPAVLTDLKQILRHIHGSNLETQCSFVSLHGKARLAGSIVDTKINAHPIPTFGFKLSYNGETFAYSGDTNIDLEDRKAYESFLSGADMIFHEATHKDDPVHTQVSSLEKLPKEIREKMLLLHVPDGFRAKGYRVLRDYQSIVI